ncbi:MAG: class I SAM-dependent methyltransferase [Bacteroidales bacterium]|nr:class I SAM-dependent methyltransferase [Bacteroidales bacterium]
MSHSNTNKGLSNQLYKIVRGFTLKQKYDLVRRYKSGKSILDIGSGTGELLNFFKQSGWEVQGIEPDSRARNYAVQKHNIPVEDENRISELKGLSFDVITMWHVLEHVPNLNQRIQSVRRLLKNDGIIVVAVPNPESFDAAKYGEYWAAYDLPRHLYHFKKKNVKELFAKHDIKLKEIFPMKFDAFYVSMLSEKYIKGKSKFIHAFFTGLKSNNKANKSMNYSSLIYVLEKD